MVAGIGVFFSIYGWVNWVGHQLREERDTAVRSQDGLLAARAELQRTNAGLERRVEQRTAQLQLANATLRESDELLRATIESTTDGILVVEAAGRVAHTNERFATMWRIPQELLDTRDDERLIAHVLDQVKGPEAFVKSIRELYATSREDFSSLEFNDGRVFERYSRPLLLDGAVAGRVWSFRDVTERRRAEERLREQATHDALTGALNHATVTEMLDGLADGRNPLAVLMIDVDDMKATNDTYGHQLGDELLIAVARTLMRDGAIVGRYGGDEFVAVLPNADRGAAERYRDAALDELAGKSLTDPETGSRVPVTASIGVAMYPFEAAVPGDLIRLADSAMYSAKRDRVPADGELPTTRLIGTARAAKMVGELLPLLTSPGELTDKLRLVAHRLSGGAGYDAVHFQLYDVPEASPGADNTFAGLPSALFDELRREGRDRETRPISDVLRRTHRPLILDDLGGDERFTPGQRRILEEAGVRSGLIVPMIWRDEVVGSLSVGSTRERAFTSQDAQFLTAIANQVTAIARMSTLVEDLQSASERVGQAQADTVVMLAAAAEAHDHTTGRHLQRVRAITEALARELQYSDDNARELGLAAVLHDIGKIRVPDSLLSSSARLTEQEWAVMKQHTVWGAEFLAERPGFELAATVARAHHERWDGQGYPYSLTGDDIPEPAAIVSVADAFDAITSDRPYRSARSLQWAIDEIGSNASAQFSPRVVSALLRLYDRNELPGAMRPDTKAA